MPSTPPIDFDPIKYMNMFHLSDDLEVKIQQNIGPQKKSVVVIDNFYKDPDAVRQLCLESEKKNDPQLLSYMPGTRVHIETTEVRRKLYSLFKELCFDRDIWGPNGNPPDVGHFNNEWQRAAFMCNVINDQTLMDKPMGIIPHQDSYTMELPPIKSNHAAVIYLNTPEECAGGTNLWSKCGEMSIPRKGNTGIHHPPRPQETMDSREVFEHIHWSLFNNEEWKVEHEFEMVYNRMALYESKVLHSQNVDLGMFTDYDRINQVLFM